MFIHELQHTEDARPRSAKTVTHDNEDSNVIMKNDAGLFKGIYSIKCIT